MQILICDDDPIVHQSLALYLEVDGFEHKSAFNGSQALTYATACPAPDLVLLDIMMQGMSGIEVCKALRKVSKVPVIMLTAKGEEIDKVTGLEIGADDYIVKPFSPREVISRIKAVLRRTNPAVEKVTPMVFGELVIDADGYIVTIGGEPIQLAPREIELLSLLASHPGRVYPRETILSQVWGYDYYGDSRTVDTHVKRLRQKLMCDERPWQIITVYGVGYKFEVRAE